MIPRGQKTDAGTARQQRTNEADVGDAHGEAWLSITKVLAAGNSWNVPQNQFAR